MFSSSGGLAAQKSAQNSENNDLSNSVIVLLSHTLYKFIAMDPSHICLAET